MRNPESRFAGDFFEGTEFEPKEGEGIKKRSPHHRRAEKGFGDLRKIVEDRYGKKNIERDRRRKDLEERLERR